MAVMGTFSSFTTARLAIYASQASLNVTGNNISNINTPGYSRQRMDLVSLHSNGAGKYKNIYSLNVGYGVMTNGVTQLRDPYLDIRYRNESAKLGANSEKLDGLTQMSRILDEVGKGTGEKEGFGVIEAQFGSVYKALQNLEVNVGSPEYDDLVRTEADILATYFNKAAQDLQDIQDIKSKQIYEYVADINKLLTNIRDLNEQIRTQGIYGDNALELRDARNTSLDKLSEYMHINVEYSMERIDQFSEVEKLTVTLAGSKGPDGNPIKLVDGIFGGQISIPEEMPVMNPDYNPVAINRAKEQTRKEAEEANPLSNWKPGIDKQMAEERKAIEAANAEDQEPWATQIKEAVDKALGELSEDATDEEKEAAGDEAKAAVNKTRLETIEAAVAKKEKELWRAAKAQQQGIVNDAVQKKEDELVASSGKYLKTKADPDANPPVAAEYTNDPEEALTYVNDKYLMQIEPLTDRRDRLMVDPNTVSKESEIVELDDVTLYGKLQSIREMLTEEGEYASQEDIDMDPNAALKRGIPYYQKALDNLARKLAEVFNEENQLPAKDVYLSAGQVYIDADGKLTDEPTDTIVTPFLKNTGNGATAGGVTDDDGNPVTTARLEANRKVIDDASALPADKAAAEADMEVCMKALRQSCVTDEKGELVTQERLDEKMNVTKDPNATAEQKAEAEADIAVCMEALRRSGVKDPLYEFYDGGVLFSNNGNGNDPSGITAANITVSAAWANGSVRVLNDKRPDSYAEDGKTVIKHSSRNDNIQHIISMFDKQLDYYARDVEPDAAATLPVLRGSFREVFTSISGTLADDTQATTGKVDSYTITTLNLDNDRLSVSGVDLNEEATSMMQFSKSYSAACRLLTTIDEMLDKLINGTAL
ncbi:MAG: hypothetical protein HDT14_08515 [Oscillibacter sp.]|nr:hypothetical protein [Oscillibacter sp.]